MAERCFGQQLLETDGCNPAFFYLLAKENKRTLRSCELHIPITILFEQGYVKALFSTEQVGGGGLGNADDHNNNNTAAASGADKKKKKSKNGGAGGGSGAGGGDIWSAETPGEIKRKSGKDVDLLEVYDSLVAGTKEGDIVAELLFAKTPGGEMNSVQFLDAKMLHRFLFLDVDKPKSLLQKFIQPKGNNNFKILATWSPLMMMAEGRRCPNALTSRHLPVSIRGATFEDPTINAVDVVVNRTVVKGINEMCCSMAAHFERTEKLSLTRFGGFFKVDENNKLFLMYPTSIRMHECDAVEKAKAPVSLSSKVDLSKPDIEMRSKDIMSDKALNDMDAILNATDKKMRSGSMLINIPSLEDNYTLIRNALHGTKLHNQSNGNVGGNASSLSMTANSTQRGGGGVGAHGTSSVYVDGPLPANMISTIAQKQQQFQNSSALTNNGRAASAMGGGGAGSNNNNSFGNQNRRAYSAMGNYSTSSLNNNAAAPPVTEKSIGAHANTNYANPKVATTSTRKTFYSTNMAGTVGSNAHSSDPSMFVNAANTTATAAQNHHEQHYQGGVGSTNQNNSRLPPPRGGRSNSLPSGGGGGGANNSSNLNNSSVPLKKSGGKMVVPLTTSTQLPQPRALLPYQHQLPNSATNMSYTSNTSAANNTNATNNGSSAMIGFASMAPHQQPLTLRQLNRKTEKQIKDDWSTFIGQAQNDIRYWEMREQQMSMRNARLGGGGGGGSPTLDEAHNRVAEMESMMMQQQHNAASSPQQLNMMSHANNNASVNAPPVKIHSTYDPLRPHKAHHAIVNSNNFANNNNATTNEGDNQQTNNSNNSAYRTMSADKANYLDLVAKRIGTPTSGGGGGGNRHASMDGSAAINGSNKKNTSSSAAAVDYESDARMFLDSVQRDYQQSNQFSSLTVRPSSQQGGGGVGGPINSGIATATPLDAESSLSKVSRSVTVPAIFSPLRNNNGQDSSSMMATAYGSQQQQGRNMSSAGYRLKSLAPSAGGATTSSSSASPTQQSKADREPRGLGGGGFGMGNNTNANDFGINTSPSQSPTRRDRNTSSPPKGKPNQRPTDANRGSNASSSATASPQTAATASSQLVAITAKPSNASSSVNDSSYKITNNNNFSNGRSGSPTSAFQFLQNLEAERYDTQKRMLEVRASETAILINNLSPTERAEFDANVEGIISDLKQYLSELAYALYDLFLMRREGSRVNRFACVEVPTKFEGFLSAPLLNKILWKLHGKVKPALKFLSDTMPQNDPNFADVSEWRKYLLAGLQVGSLGRNWPCRSNFTSIGHYLEYCTTPLVGSSSSGMMIDGNGGDGNGGNSSNNALMTFNSNNGDQSNNNNHHHNAVTSHLALTCDVIAAEDLLLQQQGSLLNAAGTANSNDNDEEKEKLGQQRGSSSNGSSPSPTRRRNSSVAPIMPISAIRRQSILNNAAAAAGGSPLPLARITTANNASTTSRTNNAVQQQLQAILTDTNPNAPHNKNFSVKELIAKHREERRRHKMSLVAAKVAEDVHKKKMLRQEARIAGLDEETYVAQHGFPPRPSSSSAPQNGNGSFGNFSTASQSNSNNNVGGAIDDADLDYFDELEDDEEEEILEDETIRNLNKNTCIVIPLLDNQGLEILKTEGFIVGKEAALYFNDDDATATDNENPSASQEALRGVIPLLAQWYVLDRMNEDAHKDERVAARRRQRKAQKRRQDEEQRRKQLKADEQSKSASGFSFAKPAHHNRSSPSVQIIAPTISPTVETPPTPTLTTTATTTTAQSNEDNNGSSGAKASSGGGGVKFALNAAAEAAKKEKERASNSSNNNSAAGIGPLDVVCQRCNSVRILCVCDKVYVASGGARLRNVM